jgi:hypothetical protein
MLHRLASKLTALNGLCRLATSARVKPPIFLVGAARSGTGLLRNLVRAHPGISIPGESHFIPHFYRGYGDPADEEAARALARRILGFSRIQRWQLQAREDDFADFRRYADLVAHLFELWAATEGKPRWGDKTPHYVSHLDALAEIYPSAQFVHIIRDGRAVANSWAGHNFGAGNIYSAAKQWRQRVRDGQTSGAILGPERYLEVRYERLLEDTDAEMRRVFEFLGEDIPDDLAALNPPDIQVNDPLWSGVSHTEVVRGNAEAWREKLAPAGRRVVEGVAGDLLEELGYALDEPRRPVPAWKARLWSAHTVYLHYARQIRRPRRVLDNAQLFVAGILAGRR